MAVQQIKLYLETLNFPWDWNQLPSSAYLVGGSVRDALLGRYKYPLDLDFVLPANVIPIAREIANKYNAGFVVLDAAREIARVVFPQGTLDFALQVGDSLVADLGRRDFTINAIAYNIARQELVDPLNGVADLECKILRMVSPTNLEDDPLRLLRAYRQSAQLNLTLETTTRQAIRHRTPLLKKIAAERVQAELNYIFPCDTGDIWLGAALEDGLLNYWLPSCDRHKIEELDQVKDAIQVCQNFNLVSEELSSICKLATLVNQDPATAEAELTQLKYSRDCIKAVTKTVKYLPSLQSMTQLMSLREQYFWFLEVKEIFPILVVRAIAVGVSLNLLKPLIDSYLNPQDLVAHPQPLLTGNDLIKELKIKPSPLIGTLLTEIQIAQIESKITTKQQALDYALSIVKFYS